MIISNQKNAFTIKIQESILTKVSTVKFLGVTLDENLIFKDHVNKVASKISKSVGVMRRLTYALLAKGRSVRTNAAKIGVLTGEHANYSHITTKRSSLFTQFMIALLY